MPRFRYTALDVDGESLSSEIEAIDPRTARLQLIASGLQVQALVPVDPLQDLEGPQTLSTANVVELTSQIASLTSAKIPLATGLQAVCQDLPRGRLLRTINRLVRHLNQGIPLDKAASMPDVRLPPYLCGLLACGLASDKLGLVLEQFLNHERVRDDLRRKMWLSFAYPTLLIVMLAVWSIFVMEVLVKSFAKIFNDFEIELPANTQSLLFLSNYVPWLAGAVATAIIVVLLSMRFCGRSRIVSNILANLPLVGPFWRDRSMAEFSNLLGLFIEYSTPLPQAFELTATGLRDGAVAAACRKSASLAESGASLAGCVSSISTFSPTMVPILAWGDRVSAPGEALASASEWFRSRCDFRSDLLAIIISPIAFVFVVLAVLYLMGGLMSPLLALIRSLT